MPSRSLAAALVTCLLACAEPAPTSALTATEQSSDFLCPTDPQTLTGSGEPTDLCAGATDCAPQCCTCPNGVDGFDLSDCDNAACTQDPAQCAAAEQANAALCP